ncbi:MAG: hypothetical protein CL792_03185 [Chloroflexi bacterium]|nr:hypothetical protein [Chloroflexota bacterium]|tara:strand:+ start:61 stop:537 length:477 start_codon:yes stop_codon:yes gene_type:complete
MSDQFPVEAGHIMLFARSIGDKNQVYYDSNYALTTEAQGIIAPPTFVAASAQFDEGYSLRPKIGEPWFGSGKTPTGIEKQEGGSGGLHAEQHYEYHRHLRPGDILHSVVKEGEKWERESKRAGKLKFSETITEYYDQNDELVITARSVGVVTERPIDQ